MATILQNLLITVSEPIPLFLTIYFLLNIIMLIWAGIEINDSTKETEQSKNLFLLFPFIKMYSRDVVRDIFGGSSSWNDCMACVVGAREI